MVQAQLKGLKRVALVCQLLLAGGVVDAVGDPLAADEWRLVWSDEFDGTQLDQASWTAEVMPDPYNGELQYYTDRIDAVPGSNAWQEDGRLIIEARAESFEHRAYTSARLITKGKREFLYGRFEARMRLPHGVGAWPAFWLLGGNIDEVGWPACGEIDIMEGKGRLPNWTSAALHRGLDPASDIVTAAELELETGDFHAEWHVFAVEWEPGRIRWFVDEQQLLAVERPADGSEIWPFDDGHKFYLLLNLALGGWFDSPHRPPEDMEAQRLHVDYVRVYRREASAGGTEPASLRDVAARADRALQRGYPN